VTTWGEWVVERFQQPRFKIKISQVVIHKANQPDIIVHFFEADRLAGKDRAEVNFFRPRQIRPQLVTTMIFSWKG
jgi:hypothetical protein